MTARVLLVEDDRSVREIATLVLEAEGFTITAVADGLLAVGTALSGDPFDLVILDLMLPGLDGLDVCRSIRARSNIPIVILTARAEAADVVRGLECGADDYVTKPFEPAVLVARVRAVLRRSNDGPPGGPVLRCRDLAVDEHAFVAYQRDVPVSLTNIELRLLAELIRESGAVLTRAVLLERVWGYDYLGDSRLVDMAIKRLRDKLGDPTRGPGYITTVRGIGYRLEREE